MFDLGGVTREEFMTVVREVSVETAAIRTVLVRAGLATAEEFETLHVQVRAIIDQKFSEKQAEAAREFDEKHPGIRKLFGKALGLDSVFGEAE